MSKRGSHFVTHIVTPLAVADLNFLQRCIKLNHLHHNKRPATGRECGAREAVHQQERIEPRRQAGPLTPPPIPTTTASLTGQTNGWHGACSIRVHTFKHTHTHREHLPHTSLSTRLLLPLTTDFFFQLFSLSWSSCSES